jgi:tetratricopeptide (TPR) repeat protein
VSQPSRSRWFINLVLALGVVFFIGFSMLPLLEGIVKESQPAKEATPSANLETRSPSASLLANQGQEYEFVLKQEPDNQAALKGLVEVRIRQRDFSGAIAPLEKLIALNPNEGLYHLVLGQVYAAQKNSDRANVAFDRAIEVDSKDYRPVLGKALLLKEQGKVEQAKPLFEQAAALAPTPAEKDQINQLANPQPATPAPTSPPPGKN